MPTPNKLGAHSNLKTGFGRFYGESAYGSQFMNMYDDKYKEHIKMARVQANERKQKFQKGSISPHKPLPFIGKRRQDI